MRDGYVCINTFAPGRKRSHTRIAHGRLSWHRIANDRVEMMMMMKVLLRAGQNMADGKRQQ